MSADDISQIIDRLSRMEEKQDKQAEKIENLRVAMATKNGENSGSKAVRGDFLAKLASYGGLLAVLGAALAVVMKK